MQEGAKAGEWEETRQTDRLSRRRDILSRRGELRPTRTDGFGVFCWHACCGEVGWGSSDRRKRSASCQVPLGCRSVSDSKAAGAIWPMVIDLSKLLSDRPELLLFVVLADC